MVDENQSQKQVPQSHETMKLKVSLKPHYLKLKQHLRENKNYSNKDSNSSNHVCPKKNDSEVKSNIKKK